MSHPFHLNLYTSCKCSFISTTKKEKENPPEFHRCHQLSCIWRMKLTPKYRMKIYTQLLLLQGCIRYRIELSKRKKEQKLENVKEFRVDKIIINIQFIIFPLHSSKTVFTLVIEKSLKYLNKNINNDQCVWIKCENKIKIMSFNFGNNGMASMCKIFLYYAI